MANSLKCVNIVQLGTSFSTIYTVPGSTNFTVSMLHLVNTGSASTVDVCVVPSGGTAQQSNAIMWQQTITINDVLEILKGDIWNTGTTLQARAQTGSAINLKLAGIETT